MSVWLARSPTFGAALFAVSLVAACAPEERRSDGLSAAPRSDTATAGQGLETPSAGSNAELLLCGGQTPRSVVDRYFEDLEKALAEPRSDSPFNRFVRRKFSIRDAQGTVLHFDIAKVEAVTPDIIALEEWQQISSKGPDRLQEAGWRGCFLDHGKVWFGASEEHGLRLTSIFRDVPWDGSTSN